MAGVPTREQLVDRTARSGAAGMSTIAEDVFVRQARPLPLSPVPRARSESRLNEGASIHRTPPSAASAPPVTGGRRITYTD
jgi:hypothetical protein